MRVEKIAFPDMDRRYSYFGFCDYWSVVIYPSLEKDRGEMLFYSCWWKDGKCYALKTVSRNKASIMPDGKQIPDGASWFRAKYRAFRSMPFCRSMEAPVLIEADNVAVIRHETLAEFVELEPESQPVAKKPRPCVVYFVQGETIPLIKIGIAKNFGLRFSSLQTGSPDTLRILAVIPGSREKEIELHKRFSRLRVRGEWFRPEPELLNYIESIKE